MSHSMTSMSSFFSQSDGGGGGVSQVAGPYTLTRL